jgi:hypothetical protein
VKFARLSLTAGLVLALTAYSTIAGMVIKLDDGEKNWILVEGATRAGATFTFAEVHIDGNGWLVMHPFEDGKPNGDIYVGATYVHDGDNRSVEITLDHEPATGDMFIVMLHRDVNENQEFDFVFVDAQELSRDMRNDIDVRTD